MKNRTLAKKSPSLVYANEKGEIIDVQELSMAGRSGMFIKEPNLEDLIPLPEGSEMFVLPDRFPIGVDRSTGSPVVLKEDPYEKGSVARAVAAFVAPAYTTIYTSAYEKARGDVQRLPLFAYTAVGWKDGRFWAAAFRSDDDTRQDACQFDQRAISARTRRTLKKFPHNRLIQHLGHCCLVYGCPAARNYFLKRWEAPVPTSPACNARCVGCISLQTSGCCPSTQERITFVPTAEEIVEMAVPHLNEAPRPVVSFGQGCEGEPLLQTRVIEESIRSIRSLTSRGTINLNTNASLPGRVERLANAGLDSIRVSLNSAQSEKYELYYRPKEFSFESVKESIRVMKKSKRFVSLNYFILPGFTDDPEETGAFLSLLQETRPDLVQLRNLNMDPDWYFDTVRHAPSGKPLGMLHWRSLISQELPDLRCGYFNPYLGPE